MKKPFHVILLSIFLLSWVSSISQEDRHPALIPGTGGHASSPATGFLQNSVDLPALPDFIASIRNDDPGPVGVYVPQVFALPILQQPANQPAFVSTQPESVTQFRMSAQYNNLGLLAHNYLSGAKFFEIGLGQSVFIVNGAGEVTSYLVTSIRRFQALEPESIYSDFLDLDRDGIRLSNSELFNLVFTQPDQVVFQTCIAKDGNASWGRIFIIASKVGAAQAPTDHSLHILWYHKTMGHLPMRG